MIASAVVVPEPEPGAEPRTSSPSRKRRQSSVDSDSSKRPRLDTQTSAISNDARSPTSATSPPRRKSSALGSGAAEERKRGQRLFGALLGTLSQTSAKPAHRRRDEIEKRQRDKLRQKDEELAEEKRKKREEIDVVRREEQKIWNEQAMHIRHRNMRATAHFLKTKAEPSLYYRPWDLRAEEEDQIRRQVEETESRIEQEVAEHMANKQASLQHSSAVNDVPAKQAQNTQHTLDEKNLQSEGGDGAQEKDTKADHQHVDQAKPIDEDREKMHPKDNSDERPHDDHGGEELVEGQEDDVIY